MKKMLLALGLIAGLQTAANAQAYTFTSSTGTYTDLTSPTVLTSPAWDDEEFTIPIGFPFTIFDPTGAAGNLTVDSVSFDTYGDLYFSSATDLKLVTAYEADMMDLGTTTSLSPVSYQLTGTAGSRILKIEFKNAGFFGQSAPVAGEFTNFQVWLYEGSNKIEMHYGPNNVSVALNNFITGTGSSHGIAGNINGTTGTVTGPFLSGPAANPTMNNATVPFDPTLGFWEWPSLTGIAPNGAIYAFTPAGGAIGIPEALNHAKIAMYPNPASDLLHIDSLQNEKGSLTVQVYDVLGKEVLNQEVKAAAAIPLNISQLTKGTYFVVVSAGNNRAGKQIIKQ